jgi:glutathione S-transferase
MGRRPHVEDWFSRMRARPSFARGITQWMTEADRERFDISPAETWGEIEKVMGKMAGRN